VRRARARKARIGRGHLIKTLGQDWQHGKDAIEDRKDRKETIEITSQERKETIAITNQEVENLNE
jgi:hypothetical protein